MSEAQKLEAAKQYIDKQIATMREHGSAPKKITTSEYDSMVKQVAKAITK
jgi:hypothetical protein